MEYIGKEDWKSFIPCAWCGKVYIQHEEDYEGRPKPKVPCLLLKTGFVKRENNMNTNYTGEELKEEFEGNFFEIGTSIEENVKKIDSRKIADWWLNKISSLLKARDREVVEMIEGMEKVFILKAPWDNKKELLAKAIGFNEALSKVKSKLQEHE